MRKRTWAATSIAVLIMGGTLVFAFTSVGERALSSALENKIRSSFGLSKETQVGVRADFRSLLAGRLNEIRIQGGGADVQGLQLKRLEGRLEGLDFDRGALLAGRADLIGLDHADLRAEIAPGSLDERLLGSIPGNWHLTAERGRFALTSRLLGKRISIPLNISAEKNAIVVKPRYAMNFPAAKADIPTKLLPCGLRVSDVMAGDDSIVIGVKK